MTDWSASWRALVDDRGEPAVGRRLQQGRRYLRGGRVTDVRVEAGGASARVQGDRATPYAVTLRLPVLDDDAWARIVEALAGQVRHTARLLAGQVPAALDAELAGTGVRLAPRRSELRTSCGCDDPVWPCLHVAALWEALAERFDEDPFALPRMRGRGRERLLSELAAVRRRRARGAEEPGVPLERLDPGRWTIARQPLHGVGVAPPAVPRTPAGTLRVLGDPPGWAGGMDAWTLLHPLVEGAAGWARAVDPS